MSMQSGEGMAHGANRAEVRGGPLTRRQKTLVPEKAIPQRPDSVIDVTKLKVNTEAMTVTAVHSQTMALKKYIRLYDLRDVQPYCSKMDLCQIVAEHLDSMIIDEDQVLSNLVERVRNDNPF